MVIPVFLIVAAAHLLDPILILIYVIGGVLPTTWRNTAIAACAVCVIFVGIALLVGDSTFNGIASHLVAALAGVYAVQGIKREFRKSFWRPSA